MNQLITWTIFRDAVASNKDGLSDIACNLPLSESEKNSKNLTDQDIIAALS